MLYLPLVFLSFLFFSFSFLLLLLLLIFSSCSSFPPLFEPFL
jgi:hypothetical protein